MYRHLVAIEVRVIRRADQRMQLDRFPLHQYWLECLNAQPMQRRRPVQQNRMFADYLFQDVPDFRLFHFHQFLGLLDGGRKTSQFQLAIDKRAEEFQRHLLGQSALVQFQGRTDHDHRTAGIVDPLAQ